MATTYTAEGTAPTVTEELTLAREERMRILRTGQSYDARSIGVRRALLKEINETIAILKTELAAETGTGLGVTYARRVQNR